MSDTEFGIYTEFVKDLAQRIVTNKEIRSDQERFERILTRISLLHDTQASKSSLKDLLRNEDYLQDDWLLLDELYTDALAQAVRGNYPYINLADPRDNVNLDYLSQGITSALASEHKRGNR